jgi:hypothetical protein
MFISVVPASLSFWGVPCNRREKGEGCGYGHDHKDLRALPYSGRRAKAARRAGFECGMTWVPGSGDKLSKGQRKRKNRTARQQQLITITNISSARNHYSHIPCAIFAPFISFLFHHVWFPTERRARHGNQSSIVFCPHLVGANYHVEI